MDKLTQSIEDYLEAIYLIGMNGGKIKSTKIAEMLSVSRPAVNKAMMELIDRGLITKESYSEIIMTTEGKDRAETVYNKHVVIKEFLTWIGVPEDIAEIDCCKIEHVISDETYSSICDLLAKR